MRPLCAPRALCNGPASETNELSRTGDREEMESLTDTLLFVLFSSNQPQRSPDQLMASTGASSIGSAANTARKLLAQYHAAATARRLMVLMLMVVHN